MSSAETIVDDTEEAMLSAIDAYERELGAYRTGKASPALVEGIMIDYYGTQTRLKDIAGINTPEPRLLVIQPWDQTAVPAIEKALIASDIGISPVSDGKIIRLPIPDLSEERRKDLCKQCHKRAEEAKVNIRNHRRHANEEVKKFEKDSSLNEDLMHDLLKNIQDKTDDYIKQVDDLAAKKEKEIMAI
ncbi:MAG: ribosome recycling factor [Lentisphaeria bacterium]|nr:ribosome recycling factor [Lentisphaeria bacterium]NQZ69050.1 ribosome recycling factor [Lentisphaeria bacterium]